MRLLFLAGLLSLAVTIPLRAQEDCSRLRLEQMAARVKDVQQHLLAIKVEQMDTSVPSSTEEQIRAIKESLAAFVNVYIGCQQGSTVDTKTLESRLADFLGANKPERVAPVDPEKLPEL